MPFRHVRADGGGIERLRHGQPHASYPLLPSMNWPTAACLRTECHHAEARLPIGKTLANFNFHAVPMISKAQVMAPTAGDTGREKGANLLLFGLPGAGKSRP